MNLVRSHRLAFVSQVNFPVFSLKGAEERRPSGFVRLVVLLAVLCLGSAGAWAATCTVNSTADTNTGAGAAGTLRFCLSNLAAGLPATTNAISFSVSLPATITLTGTLPDIEDGVTITGPGASQLIVSGADLHQAMTIGTTAVPAVVLSGITIAHAANGAGDGGGISIGTGSLKVSDCVFSANSAGKGGAIYNGAGTLTISGSTFSLNSASVDGGAVDNNTGATLTVTSSTFSTNSAVGGGAIYNAGTTATVVNSTFSGNSAGNGGGILNAAGTLTAGNNIFALNTATTAGAGVEDLGTANANFNVYNNNFVGGSEDDCHGCTTNTNATSATANPLALPLGNYGGPNQTLLPQPGSEAICAGAASVALAASLTTDQRGYPLHPTGGYCPATNIDAGAAQTNYASVNFVQQPSTVALGAAMSPAPTVNILETDTLLSSTGAVDGIPITLTYSGTGTLSGNSATTAGGVATFSSLKVSTTPGTSETLGVSVPVTPSAVTPAKTLTDTSGNFNVIGPATTLVVSAPASTTAGAPFSVTVTAQDAAGNTATGYAGTVHFTSTDSGTSLVLPPNYTFVPATDHGVHTFTNGVALVTVGAGTQKVTATDSVTGTITGFATVTVNKATPNVTMTPAGAAINVDGSVTFTATVAPSAGSVSVPFAGTMLFASNGTTITGCSTQLVNANTGVATCATTALLAGPDAITATYSGDGNYNAANATAINQVVTKLSPTLVISPTTTAALNTPVTLRATVGGVTITPNGPSGTVTFNVGGNPIICANPATQLVNSTTGVATCTTSSLLAGTDSITATYPGDGNYNAANATAVNQVITKLSPTLVISPTTTAALNTPVTLTATVGGVTTVPNSSSGTVTFKVGGSAITCANPATQLVNSAGVAACTTSSLLAGTDVITATYPGDGNYDAANATAVNQTVTPLNPTFTFSTPAASVGFGSSVTFTVNIGGVITPVVPKGTVTFTINGSSSSDCPAVTVNPNGTATCTTSSLAVPSDVILATYGGDPNYTISSTASVTQKVVQNTAQTALSASSSSSPALPSVNQLVTFTATVKPPTGWTSPLLPTGSVTFTQQGVSAPLCAAAAISATTGIANCSFVFTSAIPSPGATISATYSGDTNFGLGTAGTLLLVVNPSTTTTTVSSSPNPSAVNQSVTISTSVTPTNTAGTAKPTGTVTITTNPASSTCTEKIAGGIVPACSITFTTNGAYTVVATYNSDANFSASSSPSSGGGAYVQTVGAGTTSLVLGSSPNPSAVNQPVTFNAIINFVTSGSAQPTGSVIFMDGATTLCAGGIFGTATTPVTFAKGSVPPCTVPLSSQGTHSITAKFTPSDSNFTTSSSTLLPQQVVNKAATVTSVTSSPNPSAVNQAVTATATVTPAFTAGTAVPGGTVSFSSTPATTTCTVTIVSGVLPACTFTFTLKGSYVITATYNGDGNFTASTSPSSGVGADNQQVGVQTTTVSLTSTSALPAPNTSTVNQQVKFNATINLTAGTTTNPTGTVTYFDGATTLPGCTFTGTTAAPFTGGAVPACTATLFSATTATVTHAITAVYSGDSNFGGSTGNLTQIVNPEATGTTVVATLPPSTAPVTSVLLNTPVTFTATVTPSPSAIATNSPTGTVTFTYNGTALCTSVGLTPAAGLATATCAVTLPAAGLYPVIATYSSDSNFVASTSAHLNFTVGATGTSLSLSSSLQAANGAVVSQLVTFTARVVSANPGAVAPNGTVAFKSTDINNIADVPCSEQPVTSVASLAVPTGFDGIAHCSVQFPITEQFTGPITVSATYTPTPPPAVQDFAPSTSSILQTVQNYSVTFTAPAVSSTPPALAPVFVTQGYSTTTDPFNPKTSISATVSTSGGFTGGFSDPLTVTCSVVAISVPNIPSRQAVSDPSCSPASTPLQTSSGSSSYPVAFTMTASPTAPIGSYSVAITVTDTGSVPPVNSGAAYSLSQTTVTPVVAYVVGESTALTLAQGATGTGNAVFNTATPASGVAPTTIGSFACGSVYSLTKNATVASPGISCSGPTTPVAVTAGGSTQVSITISTSGLAAALKRSSTIYAAAFLGLPLLSLVAWFGNWRSSRRNFIRFISLILLIVGISSATGCGGSFSKTGGQPSSAGLPPGSYLVQVVATDQNGVKYYAVIPLTVNPNN